MVSKDAVTKIKENQCGADGNIRKLHSVMDRVSQDTKRLQQDWRELQSLGVRDTSFLMTIPNRIIGMSLCHA